MGNRTGWGSGQQRAQPDAVAAELRRSERRFRDIAEATSDWIWETDADHRFTYVSDKIQKVSGTPGAAFIGRTVAEVMKDAEGPDVARHLADLHERNPVVNFCYWIERPFGRRCCSVTGYPMFDDDGVFCGSRGIGSDVTELKPAEERQELLVAELRHGSKTLATVMSLLTLTMRSAGDWSIRRVLPRPVGPWTGARSPERGPGPAGSWPSSWPASSPPTARAATSSCPARPSPSAPTPRRRSLWCCTSSPPTR